MSREADQKTQGEPDPAFVGNVFADLRLEGGPAVGALIVTEDGRYLMQQRDRRPDIYFPGHWGMFGGAVNPGENMDAAILRELVEEIGFRPDRVSYFTRFVSDLSRLDQPDIVRVVYETPIDDDALAGLRLAEGRDMRVFIAEELLTGKHVVPYDAFAVWLHRCQARFGADSVSRSS